MKSQPTFTRTHDSSLSGPRLIPVNTFPFSFFETHDWIFQGASFLYISPPNFYMQFPFHPYLLHLPPNSPAFQGTSPSPEPRLKFENTATVTTRNFLPSYTTYEDGTDCSETSAYKIQTLENCPEGRLQHSEQGESLKSRTFNPLFYPPN